MRTFLIKLAFCSLISLLAVGVLGVLTLNGFLTGLMFMGFAPTVALIAPFVEIKYHLDAPQRTGLR